MSDAPALRAAIRAAPDDDAPRLVYADWLDEHGHPERAEFIRVQCERDRTDRLSDRWFDLDNRATELRTQHYGHWMGPLRPLKVQGDFRRGFVEPMYLPITTYIDRHTELTALEPVVDVRFSVAAGVNMAKRAASPTLQGLRGLSLEDSFVSGDRLKDFLASRHLGQLERLNISRASIGSRELAAIAASVQLPELRELSLSGNPISDGLKDARTAELLAGLETLNLEGCQMGLGSARALGRIRFRRLRVLKLRHNQLDDELPDAFGDWAAGLRELFLGGPVSDASAEAIFQPGRFPNLELLQWTMCGPISKTRLSLLSDPERFPRLQTLGLHDIVAVDPTTATPMDVRRFLASPVVAGLQRLTMPVERPWSEAFRDVGAGRGLRQLILPDTTASGPEDFRLLLCSESLNELRELGVWEIGDADGVLREVAASGYLRSLKRAAVRGQVSAETVAAWKARYGPAIWGGGHP